MLQPGTTLSDQYQIEAVIGEGAFGRVYRARDLQLGRPVAVKELLKAPGEHGSSDYARFAERFRREARVQAQFDHPNLVHVYELLEPEPGVMYLVTEFVDGGSLREVLARRGRLPVDEALNIVRGVLAGLAVVHRHAWAIVHRDVKPSNILLTGDGTAKLTDFGVAQIRDDSIRTTQGQPHPGTPFYMSPEQAGTIGYLRPASDLYSVGCVLFELLTGVPYRQAQDDDQALRDLRPDVPAWLEAVVAQALADEPLERFKRAEGMAAALAGPPKAPPVAPQSGGKGPRERSGLPGWIWAVVGLGIEALAVVLARLPRLTSVVVPAWRQHGDTLWRSKDRTTMVLVPAGEFLMGSPVGEGAAAEHPQHTVYLDAYWVDRTEVTNAQYTRCVAAGACQADRYATDSAFNGDDQPVVGVDWNQATAYCQWTGARLPTEAEWEKAARGTDGRTYPWGNQRATCDYAVMDDPVMDVASGSGCGDDKTSPVGRKPAGASPYDALDMAGNVWEWVADWYDADYYGRSPRENPAGPSSGEYRVLRGGAWSDYGDALRAADRNWDIPVAIVDLVGFRCAASTSSL